MRNRYQSDAPAQTERERLILEHVSQVWLIAHRIHERLPGHVPIEDLVSTGIVGLIAAIDNFNPARNVQLRTYAEYKIRGAIMDSLRELDWAPRKMRKKAKQIESAINAAQRRWGREPAEEEIAAELKLSLDEYQRWLTEVQGIDMDTLEYAGSNGSGDLLRFIADRDEKLPSQLLERSELEHLLAEAIDHMPAIERTVLSLYYDQELSLREIGQVLKLHLSRVSQLKAQAILRLRSYIEKRWSVPARNPQSETRTDARTSAR